jgi:uncharacterized protein YcbK (DUF882 family)
LRALIYFKESEFNCQETGENEMEPLFLEMLDELRHRCQFPFTITSGYRSPRHSVEVVKDRPGQHAQGLAADIHVSGGNQRFILVREALKMGFTGIGVAKGFIHVDIRTDTEMLWSY